MFSDSKDGICSGITPLLFSLPSSRHLTFWTLPSSSFLFQPVWAFMGVTPTDSCRNQTWEYTRKPKPNAKIVSGKPRQSLESPLHTCNVEVTQGPSSCCCIRYTKLQVGVGWRGEVETADILSESPSVMMFSESKYGICSAITPLPSVLRFQT